MSLHSWTNGGENVLALRVINADGTSGPNNDFKNPTEPGSIVECSDWDPTPECGNGLYCWPWGHGRSGKLHSGKKIWQVVSYELNEYVPLNGKVKCKRLKIIFSGTQSE